MPASVLVELAANLVFSVGSEIVLAVGSGEKRSSAVVRLVAYGAAVALCGLGLFIGLSLMLSHGLDWWPGLLTAGTAVGGGHASVLLADEIRRLRHWGEPALSMSHDGLLIARSGRLIPWAQMLQVTQERRGLRIRTGRRSTLLPTRQPEALLRLIQDHRRRYG
jgi:hypothetical protein